MTDGIRKLAEEAYEQATGETEETTDEQPQEEEAVEAETETPEDSEEAPEAEPEEQPTEEDEVALDEPEAENDYAALLAPDPLNEEERGLFEELPDTKSKKLVKNMVTRLHLSHQQSMSRKMQHLNKEFEAVAGKYQGLDKVEERFQHRFQDGSTPVSSLETSLEWDEYLDESPHQAIAELMNQYGVTPHDYLNGQAANFQPQPQPYQQSTGPTEAEKRLDDLEKRIKQEKVDAVHSQIDGDLATFTNATDENGAKLYPLTQYITEPMSLWVDTLQRQYPEATNLQVLHHAYQYAVAQAPQEIRDLVPARPKDTTKKPAKKPSSLVSKSNGRAAKTVAKKKTIRELAEEAYEANVNS